MTRIHVGGFVRSYHLIEPVGIRRDVAFHVIEIKPGSRRSFPQMIALIPIVGCPNQTGHLLRELDTRAQLFGQRT